MLKTRLKKLEKRLIIFQNCDIAFINGDTMAIPTICFVGSISDGYERIRAVNGNPIIFIGEENLED